MKVFFKSSFFLVLALGVLTNVFSQNLENSESEIVSFSSNNFGEIQSVTRFVKDFEDPNVVASSLGKIADLVWKNDEPFARHLFEYSINKLTLKKSDTNREVFQKTKTFKKVITLIARHDPDWTRNLVISFSKESKKRAETNLEIAENLIDSDPALASEFANQSMQIQITDGLLWFLKNLKQRDPANADNLFLQIVQRYPQQDQVDARQYGMLGTYLFTSPNLSKSNYQTISLTRVGDIIFPNISANLPNISPNVVREYIKNAVLVINAPTSHTRQKQFKYALGYLLIPKAREFAPELVGELSGAITSMFSEVPANITDDDAYDNINKKKTGSLLERIEETEKISNAYTRDQILLDITYQAWSENDFRIAKLATSKIDSKNIQDQLEDLILFGEGRELIEKDEKDLFGAMRIANKLPISIEKSLLWAGIAKIAGESNDELFLDSSINAAIDSSIKLDNNDTPFLLIFLSAENAERNSLQANTTLRDAIKYFNKLENVGNPNLSHKVTLEPLTIDFSLAIKKVHFDFQKLFKQIISNENDNSLEIINEFKDERLKGLAFVALVESILKHNEDDQKKFVIQDKVIKVGEDGIRNSAKKVVMPIYPKASANKAKGVAVAEIQYNGDGNVTEVEILESPDSYTKESVINALRKWKFEPSKLRGKPVSIRGKITFYFVIENKTGKVKNPKQFQ